MYVLLAWETGCRQKRIPWPDLTPAQQMTLLRWFGEAFEPAPGLSASDDTSRDVNLSAGVESPEERLGLSQALTGPEQASSLDVYHPDPPCKGTRRVQVGVEFGNPIYAGCRGCDDCR